MGEPHLDALALMPRSLEGFGIGKGAGDVPGALIDAARDLAHRRVGAASRLERARRAMLGAAAVEERGVVVDQLAGCRQGMAGRTGIGVGRLVEAEVLAG